MAKKKTNPEVLEGPNIHNGVRIPKSEAVLVAKNNPQPQKQSLKDRAKATNQ